MRRNHNILRVLFVFLAKYGMIVEVRSDCVGKKDF